VMFALLISMQNAVDRSRLGIATSLNQFSRSIGQTVGVAVMGTVMTLSLVAHVSDIQRSSGLSEDEVSKVVHNASALIDPVARTQLKPELLKAMQNALAEALHKAFLVGVGFAALSLLSGFWLPRRQPRLLGEAGRPDERCPTAADCERMLMAEMTTIDAEHEPVMVESDR